MHGPKDRQQPCHDHVSQAQRTAGYHALATSSRPFTPVNSGATRIPRNNTTAEIATATVTARNADRRFVRSEIYPISVGEIASPRIWITKIFAATAVARILAETEFTSAAFSGAVFS